MKYSILLITLLLFSQTAISQVSDMKLTWGEKLSAKKMLVTELLNTGEPNQFYAINQSLKLMNRETRLEKYDDLKKTEEVDLTREYKRGEYSSQEILELNNNLYSLNYNRTKPAISLTAEGIDQGDLAVSGSPETIYNFKLTKGRKSSYGEYMSSVSNEEQRIAYAIEHPGKDESKSVMTVKVFDDNFDKQWSARITLPSTKKLTSIYSMTVSDDGTVYLLTEVKRGKKERERKERNYEFYLIVVSAEGIESKEKLKLKENYINDVKLNIAPNGDLMCGGLYSINGYISSGTFYMTLDAEDYSIKEHSLKEFSMEFLTEGMSDRQTSKAKRKKDKGKDLGLTHVRFRDFIAKEDGGAVLIGEYVYIYTTTTTNSNGGTTTTTHYRYNNIYVINVNADGEIEWAKKIPKYQYSTNDGGFYSGFFLVVKGDKLHFIFNDHSENAGLNDASEKIMSYTRKLKTSALMVASMDNDGNYTREILVAPDKKANMRLRPKSCEQISEDEFILFGISKKFNQFARVTVK
ncbi:hypothetical protein OAD66_07520 [Bacteroidia bacterium]|nr:hypothetical protein [Bacteroidia bacterium]MDB9882965.1 hypothetical protein [Bacteroidia bacterium]